MGLPAPPPPPSSSSASESTTSRPAWHADPNGWIPLHDNNNHQKARVVCVLHNLASRPALNGSTALVVGWEPSIQRYRVQLCQDTNNQPDKDKATILSVSPDKVQRASIVQAWYGKWQILLQQRHQIWKDARHWLQRVVPVGILAGHAGPTTAQLDEALMTLLMGALLGLAVVWIIGWYYIGCTKTAVVTSFCLTVLVVVGPEFATPKNPTTTMAMRCRQRWIDSLAELLGFLPSTRTAMIVTLLWCAYVTWTLGWQ